MLGGTVFQVNKAYSSILVIVEFMTEKYREKINEINYINYKMFEVTVA